MADGTRDDKITGGMRALSNNIDMSVTGTSSIGKEKNISKDLMKQLINSTNAIDIDGDGNVERWEKRLWSSFAGDDKKMTQKEAQNLVDYISQFTGISKAINKDKNFSESLEKRLTNSTEAVDIDLDGTVEDWETNLWYRFYNYDYSNGGGMTSEDAKKLVDFFTSISNKNNTTGLIVQEAYLASNYIKAPGYRRGN